MALFLSSTREYLANKLEIPDMSDEETKARELVHTLLRNPQHREALDLIQRYSPTSRQLTRRVDDVVQERLVDGWGSLTHHTYPSKRGARLYEAKWGPAGRATDLPFDTFLMLRSLRGSDWARGVEIHACVMACSRVGTGKEALRESTQEYRDPSMAAGVPERWTWWRWSPLLVSEAAHVLDAMQGEDAEALFKLLEELLARTASTFRAVIESEDGHR